MRSLDEEYQALDIDSQQQYKRLLGLYNSTGDLGFIRSQTLNHDVQWLLGRALRLIAVAKLALEPFITWPLGIGDLRNWRNISGVVNELSDIDSVDIPTGKLTAFLTNFGVVTCICGICQDPGTQSFAEILGHRWVSPLVAITYRYPPLTDEQLQLLGLWCSNAALNLLVGVHGSCTRRGCQSCGRKLSPQKPQIHRWLAFRAGKVCERCQAPQLGAVKAKRPTHQDLRHLSRWAKGVTDAT